MLNLLRSVLLIFVFLVLFIVVNLIHFRYFIVHVVLYDALLDAAIALVLFLILYVFALRKIVHFSINEIVLVFLVNILLAGNFAISVPTVIDRSLSMYILEKMAQRGGGIKVSAFKDIFADEFVKEAHLVDIRLTEQVNSGTLVIKDGCAQLTRRGWWIAALTRFYRNNLLPKKREIMGSLTDALTDPFRSSSSSAPYTCRIETDAVREK